MKILITGSAGFIGFHLSRRLMAEGHEIHGIDNLNDYYDPNLKLARLAELQKPAKSGSFHFTRGDIADRQFIPNYFAENRFDIVVNLAAQAGVRYSLKNPHAYVDANLVGFVNILEGCRHTEVNHLVYASSSSVYGSNTKMPFSVSDNVDHPVSLYAATKKANELMAHTYSHLYQLPTTGLRFFTVYGPWGRPDMALFLFTKAILEGKPIDVFNHGKMKRDFTYIDDIIEGVVRVTFNSGRTPGVHKGGNDSSAEALAKADEPLVPRSVSEGGPTKSAPYKLYNIGNHNPVELMDMIGALEKALGREAIKNFTDIQPGDVPATYADVDDLIRDVGFKPDTNISDGIQRFVDWYRGYFR